RRLWPERRCRSRRRRDAWRRAPAVWLSLSLCVRDAARHRRPRHLDDARELNVMTDWPILSTVTFLPLVGVLLLLLTREDSPYGRRNILNVSLLTTVFTFIVSLFIWIGFD